MLPGHFRPARRRIRGGFVLIAVNDLFEPLLGVLERIFGKGLSDSVCEFFSHGFVSGVMLRVLSQMEIAALEFNSGKDRQSRFLQTGMVVANNEFDAVQAASSQSFKKGSPMHFSFGE